MPAYYNCVLLWSISWESTINPALFHLISFPFVEKMIRAVWTMWPKPGMGSQDTLSVLLCSYLWHQASLWSHSNCWCPNEEQTNLSQIAFGKELRRGATEASPHGYWGWWWLSSLATSCYWSGLCFSSRNISLTLPIKKHHRIIVVWIVTSSKVNNY